MVPGLCLGGGVCVATVHAIGSTVILPLEGHSGDRFLGRGVCVGGGLHLPTCFSFLFQMSFLVPRCRLVLVVGLIPLIPQASLMTLMSVLALGLAQACQRFCRVVEWDGVSERVTG